MSNTQPCSSTSTAKADQRLVVGEPPARHRWWQRCRDQELPGSGDDGLGEEHIRPLGNRIWRWRWPRSPLAARMRRLGGARGEGGSEQECDGAEAWGW
ncbi:hypothetical protein BS78_01G103800 [Paspalum vaginatum]|nr:hypothetical protein BS78_01G103800 [Paspalum vaginatum]